MVTIDYMVVADAATAADGKHYIHGAGWDTIFAQYFPTTHPTLAIAFLLRVPWNETNIPCRVEVDIADADAVSILPNPPGPIGGPITIGRPSNAIPGSDLVVPLVFNLTNVPFSKPGDYVIVMRREGEETNRRPIHLVPYSMQAR